MIFKIPKKTDVNKLVKGLSYAKRRRFLKLSNLSYAADLVSGKRIFSFCHYNIAYYKLCVYVCKAGKLTISELEAMRKVLVRYLRKKATILLVKKNFVVKSKKPSEVRMGKGKGNVKEWFLPVRENAILIEFYCKGFSKTVRIVEFACNRGVQKLSLPAKVCILSIF